MMNHTREFREAISATGLVPPDIIEPGRLYRMAGIGKRKGNGAGWCKLFDDGMGGVYGDFSQDFSGNWQAARAIPFTTAQREAFNRQVAESRAAARAEREAVQSAAANKAVEIWQAAQPATDDHPYLVRKGIKAHGARLHNNALVLPLREGIALHSLQFIGDDGNKKFLTDARMKGCYTSIGTTKGAGAVCIAEGFATGATIYEATGYPVAVAFTAGNLQAVAIAIRAKLPNMPLIVCADDDVATDGNPGLTTATAAALAVGGKLAIPEFGEVRPDRLTDFNDMAAHSGTQAVKQAIAGATVVAGVPNQPVRIEAPYALSPQGRLHGRVVTLVSASDIAPEPIHWLWPDWLAAGKFHILGGAPGTGKTTLAIALAATVSSGGRWPDGSKASAGNVLIWSGEDDPANTLVPRLINSGAKLERIQFVTGTDGTGGKLPFDPAADMARLHDGAIALGNVKLLIVDPVVSAVAGDSHKNTETRRALQPLVDLGAALNCAVLGITHFSKGTAGRDPTERITGSLAFAALARVVMVAARNTQADEGRPSRILARSKSNIGPDDGGFEYDLQQSELVSYPGVFASHVVWGNAIDGSAREILASADSSEDAESGQLSDSVQWLNALLVEEGGQLDKRTIVKLARENGFSERTVQRARNQLGVIVAMTGFGKNKTSVWSMPESGTDPAIYAKNSQSCQQKGLARMGKSGTYDERDQPCEVL